MNNRHSSEKVLSIVCVLAIGGGLATLGWTRSRQGSIERGSIVGQITPLEGAFGIGDERASIAVLEFSDAQCPACIAFHESTFTALKTEFVDRGLIRYVFRTLPNPSHPFARRAGEASWCAGKQNSFWPFHERLASTRGKFDHYDLRTFAESVGLDVSRFDDCIVGPGMDAVAKDERLARRLQIVATPTFLIGTVDAHSGLRIGSIIRGAMGFSAFKETIVQALGSR